MDVDYPLREGLNEARRQQPHVARQTHKIDLMLAQHRHDLALVLFAFAPLALNYNRLQPAFASQLQTTRICFVADDDCDLGVWNNAVTNRITQRQHVRPTAGYQDRDSFIPGVRQIATSRFPLTTV